MPFQFAPPAIDLRAIAPMLAVALTGVVALILEFTRPRRNNDLIVTASLSGLAIAAAYLVVQLRGPDLVTFDGTVTIDALAKIGQLLVVGATALVILFSDGYLRRMKIPFGEFYPLVLWSALGSMLLTVTSNLLLMFLGIEILSLALYVLAGMARGEAKSEESALKYFLLGAFATCFFLFGTVLLYGATGSLGLERVNAVWNENAEGNRLLIGAGFALVFVGLGFKSSFVPFHQWTPDVYQGAPTNVAAFMSTAAKFGPFLAVWRLLENTSALKEIALPAVAVVAALTMTVGNLQALGQRDLKRLLGYSSIANAGYVLAAIVGHFARPSVADFGVVAVFLIAYLVTTIGVFAVATLGARDGVEPGTLDALAGLNRRSPLAFFALALFVLSQIGIPPTAGFFGKLQVIQATVEGGYAWLGVLLALNSIVSVVYYFAILQAAYTSEDSSDGSARPARSPLVAMPPAVAGTCLLCLAGVVGLSFFLGPITSALGLR